MACSCLRRFSRWFTPYPVVPVLMGSQSLIRIWLVNYLHLHESEYPCSHMQVSPDSVFGPDNTSCTPVRTV